MGEGYILIVRAEMRKLTSSQLKAIANYLQTVEYLFKHDKIKKKINILISDWESHLIEVRESRLNKIYKEYNKTLLGAEQKCWSLRAGVIAFSPMLSKAGLTWQF